MHEIGSATERRLASSLFGIALSTAIFVVAAFAPPAAAPARAAATRISFAAALKRLSVKSEHLGGYARSLFGGWIDADGDGFSTRAEVLISESKAPVTWNSRRTILTGRWYSLYDGATWTRASDVDIDHVVPLAEAWRSGAWAWSRERRVAYANDLGAGWTLRAVTDNVNQAKGDDDPSNWMPPSLGATCRYLADWVSVKLRWKLSVDAAERSSIASWWERRGCARAATPITIEVRLAP